jgi:benzoyl-CoA reductase subunit D
MAPLITAGLDVGAKTTKAILLDGGKVLGRSGLLPTGFDQTESAQGAFAQALAAAGLTAQDVGAIVATGAGARAAVFASREISDVRAAARGASFLLPAARTVIDIGAEAGRAMRIGETGRVLDFAINEKCAAGAGAFAEAMSRALEVPLAELGPLSLKSKQEISMNAQCAVFAESEVISLIHARIPTEDIVRAVLDAIASRVASMVRRVGVEKDLALVGGLACNTGFVDSLQRRLGTEVIVSPHAVYAGALGAALEAGLKGAA